MKRVGAILLATFVFLPIAIVIELWGAMKESFGGWWYAVRNWED